MNPFREAAAAHSAAVDEVYGEALRFEPQGAPGRGGGLAGPDPVRPIVPSFTGAVSRRPMILQRQGNGAQAATNAQLADAKWSVAIDEVVALRLGVRSGDLVVRLDPPPGEPTTFKLYASQPIRGRAIHPADPV